MKKVLVVTGTRAEYGLLFWIMKGIEQDKEMKLQLIVTGSHLSKEYGYTVKQIKKDGFKIDEEIDMLIDSNKKSSIVKSMGLEMIQLAQAFDRLKPDILLILGDRYETFVAATCALMMNIPIAHMNGGEVTEGAVDNQIRHAITKMAHIHFVGAENYKDRIIKMGEEPWRVHNVGQAGLENMNRLNLLEKKELEKELKIKFDKKVFLVTYHPVTLEVEDTRKQLDNLLNAVSNFDATYIFTYPNADFGNKIIIKKINDFVQSNKNAYIYYNLGTLKYLSLLNCVDVMIGNSSSGIIEAPSFKLPVVNIGNRQKGRLRNKNIIDVDNTKDSIVKGIEIALYNKDFRKNLNHMENLFGGSSTSFKVIETIKSLELDNKLLLKEITY